MIATITEDAKGRMGKSIESLRTEFKRLRSGRAHPNLLEHILISYYGTDTPLNQVANVGVEDSRTLVVTPWEKQMVPVIEKAIMTSDLNLNPVTSGTVIRVPLPSLTEERRKEMVKIVRSEAENARIAVRNIRRDANNSLKDLLKDKEITEDEEHNGVDGVQKLTDKKIKEVDDLLAQKEKDLMEV